MSIHRGLFFDLKLWERLMKQNKHVLPLMSAALMVSSISSAFAAETVYEAY